MLPSVLLRAGGTPVSIGKRVIVGMFFCKGGYLVGSNGAEKVQVQRDELCFVCEEEGKQTIYVDEFLGWMCVEDLQVLRNMRLKYALQDGYVQKDSK